MWKTSDAKGLSVQAKKKARFVLGKAWLKAFGWETVGSKPDLQKAVIIAAPHTSNWDLPFTLALSYVFDMPISWVGKHTLFKPPFGPFMRWLGGFPVDRTKRSGAVAQAVEHLQAHENLYLVIAPEGTRKRAKAWKTGFYRIACEAKVPIVLGFLDYGRRLGGLGNLFYPTGDLDHDMKAIREFYKDIAGKHASGMSKSELSAAELHLS